MHEILNRSAVVDILACGAVPHYALQQSDFPALSYPLTAFLDPRNQVGVAPPAISILQAPEIPTPETAHLVAFVPRNQRGICR